jgi:hypothetical protein
MVLYHIYGKNQVVILHKKLGKKIAKIGYFAEFGPITLVEGPPKFVQIAQNPTFSFQKCEKTARLSGFS